MAQTVQRTCPSPARGGDPGGEPRSVWLSKAVVSAMPLLQSISLLHQPISEILRHFQSLVFLKPMLSDQLRQKRAIHTPRHIMACRNREEGAGIVVETHGVVETGRFGYALPETRHSLRTVVKPPGRPEPQARIVSGQGSQFATVGRLIQRKKNDRQIGL